MSKHSVKVLFTVLIISCVSLVGASQKLGNSPLVIRTEDSKTGVEQRNFATRDSNRYDVTASIAQLGEPLVEITGGCIKVDALLGSGADPHLYRLTRADVLKIHRSDAIHYVGHLLEAQMQHLFHQISHRKQVLAVGEGLDSELLVEVSNRVYDPHIWMDPVMWSQALSLAAYHLAEIYPECRETITAGLKQYIFQLNDVHRATAEFFKKVPPQQRVLVTSHDAFGYFGKRYGIKLVAIQGISTDRQISVRRISKLVDFLIENDIKTVFVESSVSSRDMLAVVEGAKSRGHDVKIGGSLYSDSMGKEGTIEGTYIGMFKHNISTIANGWGYENDIPSIVLNNKEQGV